MATVGSIIVKIGADTGDLVQGVGRAQTALSKVGSAAVSIGKIIASALAAAAAAIGAMALKGIQLGNELARTARIVGLTAAELGGLHHAAALSEVSTEQLDKGLQRLGRTVSDADSGLKSATRTLDELGLNANELEQLPLSEQFLKVTDAMKGMTSQGDKLRIATQLFGKSGAELIPLLDESSDSIRAMMQESKTLGLQLDQTQSEGVQATSDSLDKMKGAVTGLAMQLGAAFGPAITAAAEAITTLITSVTNALPKLQALAERFLGIKAAADQLSDSALKETLIEQIKALDAVNNRVAELRELEKTAGSNPSTQFQVNEALAEQAEIQKRINDLLAERVRRRREAEKPVSGGGGGTDDEMDTSVFAEEAQRATEMLQARLDAAEAVRVREQELLDEQLQAETDVLEAKLQLIEAARTREEEILEEQLQAETEKLAARLSLYKEHEGLLTQARKEGMEARKVFEQMEAGQKVATTIGALATITAAVAQHSKKAFELNKLAAIANAIVNTAQGATKALAQGGFAGIAMAAAVAAAGAVQIAAIKKTQFQGGGGGTTPSAVATRPVINDQPVGGGGAAGGGGTIRVEGINLGDMFTGKAVRDLLQRLQEAQKDGGRLVIA